MKLLNTTLIIALLTTFVAGCGDTINTKTYATKVHPTYPRVTGNFIDSGVKGLNYTTIEINASENNSSNFATNLTGDGGTFDYYYGDRILFKIGNVNIGTAIALSTVTPKDIVSYKNLELNTSIYAPEVNNRIRLLMSFDEDQAPENGITINKETREKAKEWSTPNYNLSENDFTDALRKATNHEISKIFTKKEAEEHFASSLRCVYSGAYSGKWILPDGAKDGFVGVMIQSDGGIVALGDGQGPNRDEYLYARGQHDMDNGIYTFNETGQFDPEFGTIVPTPENKVDGDGESSGYDRVEGSFTQYNPSTDQNETGSYYASRVGQSSNPAYRYTGFGYSNPLSGVRDPEQNILGLFTFDISTNGKIIGLIHDARTNEEPALIGHVSPTDDSNIYTIDMNLTYPDNSLYFIRGKISHKKNIVDLDWFDSNNNKLGYLSGMGCQLQSYNQN